jgi:Ca2+-binding RTX toxin-like protein
VRRTTALLCAALLLCGAALAFADTKRGSRGPDRLRGTSGPDRIFGGDSGDRLAALGGNDTITGGTGVDRIHCGPGRDTAFLNLKSERRRTRSCERIVVR